MTVGPHALHARAAWMDRWCGIRPRGSALESYSLVPAGTWVSVFPVSRSATNAVWIAAERSSRCLAVQPWIFWPGS